MASPATKQTVTLPLRPLLRNQEVTEKDIQYLKTRGDLSPVEKRLQLLMNKAQRLVSRSSMGQYLFDMDDARKLQADLEAHAILVGEVFKALLAANEDIATFTK